MPFSTLLAPALHEFREALAQPQAAQQRILQRILADNRASRFGQQHDFASIRSHADFAARIPLRDYEAHRPAIEAIARGEQGWLTQENVIAFEETGGSSGGSKLVPYTPALLAAFRRAVLPWLADLHQHRPQALAGKIFFIISPASRTATHTAGGIPVGSGDDLLYFGEALANELSARTLFLPELLSAQSAHEWQWHSARLLLGAPDLTLISLWSPTLLLAILRTMHEARDSLAAITDPARRRTVQQALSQTPVDTRALWPQLDTISAWDSHTASAPAAALQALFPHACLQGKGLLATEAVSSIPLAGLAHPLLAINSHFYEFAGEDGDCRLPHQLRRGQSYRLIVTTQGGLYRYDTGDRVHIPGFFHGVPQLEFIGRDHLVSDLCGEKLSEAFVRKAMLAVHPQLPEQALLQGVQTNPPHYRLITDAATANAERLARLDEALAANPQYAHARHIGQLAPLQSLVVANVQDYAARFHAPQQRLATRKTPLLLPPLEADISQAANASPAQPESPA